MGVTVRGKGEARCAGSPSERERAYGAADQTPLSRGELSNVKITCCCLEMLKFHLKYPPFECESSHYQAFSHWDNVKHNVFYIITV